MEQLKGRGVVTGRHETAARERFSQPLEPGLVRVSTRVEAAGGEWDETMTILSVDELVSRSVAEIATDYCGPAITRLRERALGVLTRPRGDGG